MARLTERLECPPEFQRHLADIFGVNRFGEPLFRFIWGQTETETMLTPQGYYEPILLGHNQPCWILQQWDAPELYGPPEVFYYLNTDLDTGLPVMAYPEFGRYRDVITFMSKRYIPATKQLVIETIPLDWMLIDRAIPLLIKSLEMSGALKESMRAQQEETEEAAKVEEIADRLDDALPSFYGPVSHAQIGNRTALIDRKMAQIEQQWKRFNLRKRPMKGFFQN